MSGFLCMVRTDGQPVDAELLRGLTERMAFRGPDARATWHAEHVGFGHALLCTTPESAQERQPSGLNGQVWITADARIDGRGDLLRQLRARGRRLAEDAPDAELILHAYEVWGEQCLDQLIGDFAFALWDTRRRRLFCAHDQFGVAPLYYARIGPWLLVSNTLACLLRHPAISTTLSEQAVADYLLFAMNQDLSTTFYADVRRLPPAHKLSWAGNDIRVEQYWTLPQDAEPIHYRRGGEYVEHYQELFDQAVGDRLRADAIGTHLSGGLDASSIAVTARRLLAATGRSFDLRAYTIVYEHLVSEEEGRFAALVAAAHDLPVEYLVAEEYIAQAPDEAPARVYPEPTAIANQIAETEIVRRVAGYARVLLAGFGGDPAFGYRGVYLSELLRKGQYRPLLVAVWRHLAMHRSPRGLGILSMARGRGASNRAAPRPIPEWLDPDFSTRINLEQRQSAALQRRGLDPRQAMFAAPLWSNIFAWSDPGFSGIPVKVRFPFFDLRLVRFLDSVPPIPWLQRKTLVREAMRGSLPEPIRRRPKTPLGGAAHLTWFHQQGMQPWIEELLAVPELAAYTNPTQIRALLDGGADLTPATYGQIMSVLSLAHWLRRRDRLAGSALAAPIPAGGR